MTNTLTISIPIETVDKIAGIVDRLKISRSEFIRDAISNYIDEIEEIKHVE